MKRDPTHWFVRDRLRLLQAIMEKLAGNAHISFEGNLQGFRILTMPGASAQETKTLKRNTRWPVQDFVVLPLEQGMGQGIVSALGGAVPKRVLHVQIEKNGTLQFGAYDNFHPECIYFGPATSGKLLDALVLEGVLKVDTASKPDRANKRSWRDLLRIFPWRT